ncbi:SpoIIE family protein phosphatase [Mycobacterium sp. EPa45]|uniref:SpoIIE family protein phosphatase n=1 Tax=Mycobacterium sp. EPa45 TaxID=1545728 RepID=UPI0009E54A38|nr:SpoIIE family protein phosphatase [Mycobacterium sp. EPa45]
MSGSAGSSAGPEHGGWPDRLGSATGLFGWVTVAYLAGAVLSWQSFGAGIGPSFFPPAGVTVAAMVLNRRGRWPIIVAAIVIAELAVDLRYGAGLRSAVMYALANSVEAIVGASLLLRWCRGVPDLRLRPDLAKFVAAACVAGPLTGALIGGSVSGLDNGLMWYTAVLHWWAGDAIGVLVVAGPILLWRKQIGILRARRAESVLVLAVTAALSFAAFSVQTPPAVLLLPILAWAAIRLDVIGAALAGAVVAFTANYMTASGNGLFASMNSAPQTRLALTQAFIAVMVLVSMLVAQEAAGRLNVIRLRQAELRERGRIQALARLAQSLSAALTPSQIGDAVVEHVLNDAGAQAVTLGLVSADGRWLNWVRTAGYPEKLATRFGEATSLDDPLSATEAIRTGQPVIIRSPAEFQRRFPRNRSWMALSGAASLVSWPLTSGGKPVGALGMMWTTPQPLDSAQVAYASTVATMVGQALVRAQLYADEHARAAILQAAVLPTEPGDVPGLKLAVSYDPAAIEQGLGGDWYDVMALPGGRIYLTVGDVVGHGLPAVEDMAQLRSAARAFAIQGLRPAQLLAEVNTFTAHASHGKFATLAVAEFDPATGSLSYGSAGHPPAFLRRAGSGRVLRLTEATGPVLGPVHDAVYTSGEVTVEPGDILVMYTDGLVERRGYDIEDGMSKAQSIIAGWHADTSLTDECRLLTSTLSPPPRSDDVCVLAVRFQNAQAER